MSYGYDVRGDFRRIGSLNTVTLDSEGMIRGVFAGTAEALGIFCEQIEGRNLAHADHQRIRYLNAEIFKYLRQNPAARARLLEFEKSRGWPQGLADKIGLAYLDHRITPLKKWAEERGI